MGYFYFKPSNPQYFFPLNFVKHQFLTSFFKPYTLFGRVFWWVWNKFPFVRNIYKVDNIERFVPEKFIKSIVGEQSILAFNTGTLGPERKTTVLGVSGKTEEKFFLKFSKDDLPKENIMNEGAILTQLGHLEYVPQVLKTHLSDDYYVLKTTIFQGKRLGNIELNEKILTLIFDINNQEVNTSKNFEKNIISCFSHGDFCPWNLILEDDQIMVFDWEMAGTYPLGYDLFTYIFQTTFLLNPKKGIEEIFNSNLIHIENYFSHYGKTDWSIYLQAFGEIKFEFESEKENLQLMNHFKSLLDYVK